jgi:hypothetical protein
VRNDFPLINPLFLVAIHPIKLKQFLQIIDTLRIIEHFWFLSI